MSPPAGLKVHESVTLDIELPDRTSMELAGVVRHLLPAGVVVAVQADALARLESAVRAAPSPSGPAAAHVTKEEDAASRVAAYREAAARVRTAPRPEKVRLALGGTKEERAAILRDPDQSVHKHVLDNPHLGLEEILNIAVMATVSPEVLQEIGDRREWIQRSEIAAALVRNPKTPTATAIRLLDHVGRAELRRLSKDLGVRTVIRQVALRKVQAWGIQ
jgi:hypothetical protein